MIAALFALAAAMVIGGCAAVIQGFPYVRLESGLAMVIAGSVAASSGAVLFGLGVVAAGLRRVERAAGRAPHARDAADAPAPDARPRLPPVLPAAPAFAPPVVLPPVEPALGPERSRIEPSLDRLGTPALGDRAPRNHGPEARAADIFAAPPPAVEAEPELPIPGLEPAPPAPEPGPGPEAIPEPEAAPEAARGVAPEDDPAPEDDLFADPGPSADASPGLRPGLYAAPDPEPAARAEPAATERTVVGRYASGGNTYLMFEDGSIEAETPRGRFTFASLDELKAFVDGGGETGTRGAA